MKILTHGFIINYQ